MCGKFTQMARWRELRAIAALEAALRDPLPEKSAPGGVDTVTPMREATVFVWEGGAYAARRMRWGFARKSAGAPGSRPDHIHARAETIDVLPTFADAFAHRRGLLPVKSFNEAREVGKRVEQHTIAPDDRCPLAIAVIFERWEHAGGGELHTFVMVTTPANALIAPVSERMAAVLPRHTWAKWLGAEPASLAEIKALLIPQDGDWTMTREERTRSAGPEQPGLF